MALGSTQPLTEMSTRSISWGKRWPVRKADNLPPSWVVVTKSGRLKFLELSGPVQAYNGTAVPLPILYGNMLSIIYASLGNQASILHFLMTAFDVEYIYGFVMLGGL